MKEKTVIFQGMGIDDNLPYLKADLVKISRLSNNYTVSFYQIDYQAVAISMGAPEEGVSQFKPIPITKIVMNYQGFQSLLQEIELFLKNTENKPSDEKESKE